MGIIRLKGVRTNNLQNIDLEIPLGQATAVVGVSGAGKSSLAFHTLYAEGYLRYIESISPYVRQFLDQVEKPDFDEIDGLPPAIAFRQKKPVKNPRSTVATAADIFDYLRILYAKIADFSCPSCSRPLRRYTIDEVMAEVRKMTKGKVSVCFEYQGDIAFLINRGYYTHWSGTGAQKIDHRTKGKPIHVLIDEFAVADTPQTRVFEALDASMAMGKDNVVVCYRKRTHLFPQKLHCPDCLVSYSPPDENLFSFNNPKGACETCKGFGDIMDLDPDLFFDRSLSLAAGGIIPLRTPAARGYFEDLREWAIARGIDPDCPLARLRPEEIDTLINGDGDFPGIRGYFARVRRKLYKVQNRVFLSRFTAYTPCPECRGSRFNRMVNAFTIRRRSLGDFLSLTIRQAYDFIASLDPGDYEKKISADVFAEIGSRLKYLLDSGLHYLTLNRLTFTLSKGELQRVNLAFILGSTLSDSLLIIDQPSSDLHPHEFRQIATFLHNLKRNGNTIVLVEHNRTVVEFCDQVVELGPFSGRQGGKVVFSGSREAFLSGRRTLTQDYFSRRPVLGGRQRRFSQWLTIQGANAHNLKNVTVRLPQHAFTVVVGVSGAGKSSLLYDEIYLKNQKRLSGISETLFIDAGVGRVHPNSNVASFFELSPAIRDFFAALPPSRALGYLPGHFSFNSRLGRCPDCKGRGSNEIEMQFLPAVRVRCPTCGGNGFNPEVLKIRFANRQIAEMLEWSVSEFQETMGEHIPQLRPLLATICENGMGYLVLGQKLATLASGELQRIKLIKHLGHPQRGRLFLIDEPSYGLHPFDVEMVKNLIRQLIDHGNTVVAVEHHLGIIAAADYAVELGPEGGEGGGRVIFAGEPVRMLDHPRSLTGRYLKKIL